MNIQIIRCGERHIKQASKLFALYRRFYRMPEDDVGVEAFVGERLKKKDSLFLMATDESGNPLGFTQLYPMFSSTRMVRLWVLNDLYVVPSARRKGVGKSLMEDARNRARSNGVSIMALATEKDNRTAKALYQSLGYELDTEYDHYELTL